MTEYKEDHKTKLKKTTMKDKLGAFMVTRDSAQVKTKKEKEQWGVKRTRDKLGKKKDRGSSNCGTDKGKWIHNVSFGWPG